MTIQQALEKTFSANFVAYYRSHTAHVNIVGRNFYSDHKLLQKIYEDLQDNIDTYAELLRTVNSEMPESLSATIKLSNIQDFPMTTDSETMLLSVKNDLMMLRISNKELAKAAEESGDIDIENFAADRVGHLSKFIWQLDSVLSQS